MTARESTHPAEFTAEFTAPLAELVGELVRLEHSLSSGLATALSEEKATLEQWRILEAIARLDGPTMGELAQATGMANASLSRTVDALEDSARAYRLPDPSDRRRISVHLSVLGTVWLLRIRAIISAWEAASETTFGSALIGDLQSAVRSGLESLHSRASDTARRR